MGLPSSNQTWPWKIHDLWMNFPLKPSFTEDLPLPRLITEGYTIYPRKPWTTRNPWEAVTAMVGVPAAVRHVVADVQYCMVAERIWDEAIDSPQILSLIG